jgi:hypothetical protein
MAASSAFSHRRDSPSGEADGKSSREDACRLKTEWESGSGSAVLPRLSCPELDLRMFRLLRKL